MKYTIKYFIFFINNSEMKLIKLKEKKKQQKISKLIINCNNINETDDHERRWMMNMITKPKIVSPFNILIIIYCRDTETK